MNIPVICRTCGQTGQVASSRLAVTACPCGSRDLDLRDHEAALKEPREKEPVGKQASDDFGGGGGFFGLLGNMLLWLRGSADKSRIPPWFPRKWLTPQEVASGRWIESGGGLLGGTLGAKEAAATQVWVRFMPPVAADPWTYLHGELGSVAIDHLDPVAGGYWEGVLNVPPERVNDVANLLNGHVVGHDPMQMAAHQTAARESSRIHGAWGIFRTSDHTPVYGPTTKDAVEMAFASGRYQAGDYFAATMPDPGAPEPVGTNPFADVEVKNSSPYQAKIAEIEVGLVAANPGMDLEAVHHLATETVRRYPRMVKDAVAQCTYCKNPSTRTANGEPICDLEMCAQQSDAEAKWRAENKQTKTAGMDVEMRCRSCGNVFSMKRKNFEPSTPSKHNPMPLTNACPQCGSHAVSMVQTSKRQRAMVTFDVEYDTSEYPSIDHLWESLKKPPGSSITMREVDPATLSPRQGPDRQPDRVWTSIV
jgi:hypothetical protein